MKIFLFLLIVSALPRMASAQALMGLPETLASIEAKNPELKALRHEADAAKADARADAAMPAPEVSFGYLWHGRKDVSVSQGLDWAALSGRRRAVADAVDSLAEASYAVSRQDVLTRACRAYVGAVKCNMLVSLFSMRLVNSGRLVRIARGRVAAGSGRQSDVASADMSRAQALAELTKAQAELDGHMATLAALNGGEAMAVADTALAAVGSIGGDFDTWYASVEGRISALALSNARHRVASADVGVARANAMPQVSIGYMGEFTPSESYQGVTLAVSLPVWSARRRVEQARLAALAAQSRVEAERQAVRLALQAAFNRSLMLGRVAAELRESVERNDGRDLALRALSAGEISATEALMAENLYYDAAREAVNAEAEYQLSLVDLYACVEAR